MEPIALREMQTVLDVMDSASGGKNFPKALARGHIDCLEFLESVSEFYRLRKSQLPSQDEIRIHPITRELRGWSYVPAAAVLLDSADIEKAELAWPGDGPMLEWLGRIYASAFLCADVVVELDPFSFLAQEVKEVRNLRMPLLRLTVARAAYLVESMRPLIENGVLYLVPLPKDDDWDEKNSMAARRLAKDCGRTDLNLHALYLFSALRVAETSESLVLPVWPATWVLLERISSEVSRPGAPLDLQIAASLAEVKFPWLTGLSARTLVRIHQEEEAFVEWRGALRQANRLISSTPSSADFAAEARLAVEDALIPQIRVAQDALSRSRILRHALQDLPTRATLGAVAVGSASALTGGSVSAAVASSVAGAFGASVAPAVSRRVPGGSARVVFELLR